MKHSIKTIAPSFLVLIVFVAALMITLSGVVSAYRGNDDQNDVSVASETEDTTTDEDSTQTVREKVQKLRVEAKAEIETKRKNRETLSADKRMKVCENRKKAINNKLNAYNNAADKHLTKLNSIYDKILAFQEKKQIVVGNIDELTAAADAKKLVATDAVAALKTVAADVDCTDPETAVTLGVVRDAAHTTRKALHDYRIALKNIVVAIAQAQSESAETNEDTNSEESTEQTSESVKPEGEAN